MCLLIETLKIKNGKIQNLEMHNWRFNQSKKVLFGNTTLVNLSTFINISSLNADVIYKCRVTYNKSIQNIEFETYQPKVIKSIQLVKANTLDYSFKYKDRHMLNVLKNQSNANEILIVKQNELTDLSFANVVFYTKDLQAFTPLSPLLKGTKRQFLIQQKLIIPIVITVEDLPKYKYLKPINAMLDFECTPFISTKIIRF